MSETENEPAIVEKPAVDEPEAEAPAKTHHQPVGRLERLKTWYLDRKKWMIPASVLLLILILAGVPFTRYSLAGLAVKKDFSVKILDSTANTPVSGATISLGSVTAETDGSGKAVLRHVKPGPHKLRLSKKYYQAATAAVNIGLLSQKSIPSLKMDATGRQVKISVVNLISKKPLSGVEMKIADISAKTDQSGSATVVLPAGVDQQNATLSLDGYNDAKVVVKVSGDKIAENDFNLTPAGKVYFLSKLSGKIDVVKTNLDGTDRQTVLAGTGKEDDSNTVLLASRDWKYLALLSKRAGGNTPSLYLLDTKDDSLSTIDEGNAAFTITGWINDDFVYTVSRNDIQLWQANRESLKSFNAPTKNLTTLQQTTASGTNTYDYVTQQLGDVYGYDSQIYYILNWQSSSPISTQQATFNSIKPDGSSKKAIKSFGLASGASAYGVSIDQQIEKPDKIHLHVWDGNQDNFYIYSEGQVKADSNMTTEGFYNNDYSTYLESPSGDNTFWSESRDGKNTLFIGDNEGENGKQIATLSEYNTYGWYTDDYLLVSKNSSELYAMAKDAKNIIKISDYHKPSVTFRGYGGGYGGI